MPHHGLVMPVGLLSKDNDMTISRCCLPICALPLLQGDACFLLEEYAEALEAYRKGLELDENNLILKAPDLPGTGLYLTPAFCALRGRLRGCVRRRRALPRRKPCSGRERSIMAYPLPGMSPSALCDSSTVFLHWETSGLQSTIDLPCMVTTADTWPGFVAKPLLPMSELQSPVALCHAHPTTSLLLGLLSELLAKRRFPLQLLQESGRATGVV